LLTNVMARLADHTRIIVNPGRHCMLHCAVVFFVIALITAVFGFGGIAASAVGIAKILFLVLAVLSIAPYRVSLLKQT
jgi:uncharacterized membrane protein YtjA (UPF0391 family)